MLRPQGSSTRERKSLNGLRDFRLDSDREGRAAPGSASRCRTPGRWRCRPASTTLRQDAAVLR
jgi:hypothetical protein